MNGQPRNFEAILTGRFCGICVIPIDGAAADCASHLDPLDEVLDQASCESIAQSSGGQGTGSVLKSGRCG